MSVGGCSNCSGPALSVLTNSDSAQLQQRIAAKVVKDQMESEAALVAQLMESGKQLAAATSGSRIDVRV